MSGVVKTATQNTLRKLGADARWLLDKNGVDAEKAYIAILVETPAERDRMMVAFQDEFDKASMTRTTSTITVHGVKIFVTVKEPPK